MHEIEESLLYTKDHEWLRVEGDVGVVGITDYAQRALGDIVFVELPEMDEEVDAGDELGTIESVKSVSPIFLPISGRVIEVNEELLDHPEMLNSDCYGDGWIVKVELQNAAETDGLLSANDYEKHLELVEGH